MLTGTVRWFGDCAGIRSGFIDRSDGGEPVHVWPEGVVGGVLRAGDRVQFDVGPDTVMLGPDRPSGVMATHVVVLEEGSGA